MAHASTYFPKLRRMLLHFSPLVFEYFWSASTLLHGHIALAIPSLPETNPQILERLGLRWCGSPGQIYPSERFSSRMSAWRATAFVIFTRRIGFRMSELFHKIDEDFGGSISRPVLWWCSFFFNIATALLSPLCFELLLGCSSTWRSA